MLVVGLRLLLAPGQQFFADLDGYHSCDNPQANISLDILTTTARPDIVIVKPSEVIMLELTFPFNSPDLLACARTRKMEKLNYQMVQSDLESSGFNVSFLIIEIGALGHSTNKHTERST